MEIKDLCTLIEENDDENRGVHFPLTDIYNEGWLLRLALSKGLLQKKLDLKENEKWFSEAELKSPFLHGENRENRTHADAVIGSFKIEENTATGVEIDKDKFLSFYAIEAKMFAPLSKGITSCKKEYNQATRYIGCLAQMAFEADLKNDDKFAKLGLFVIAPDSPKKIEIEKAVSKSKIEEQLNKRINNYEEQFGNQATGKKEIEKKDWWDEYKLWKDWWKSCHKKFLDNVKIELLFWDDIVKTDEKLQAFYKNCLVYNDPKTYKVKKAKHGK